MAEMSVAEMSIGQNVRGRNVPAETSVAEMSMAEMSEHHENMQFLAEMKLFPEIKGSKLHLHSASTCLKQAILQYPLAAS